MLANGRFEGNGNRDLDFGGKRIVIRSQSGEPAYCVIDCNGRTDDHHRAFWFHSNETIASVVEDITIEDGHTADAGGAIRCDGAAPMMRNVVFQANHSRALFVSAASPVLERCLFSSNIEGALSCANGASLKCISTIFTDNYTDGSGGAIISSASSPEFVDCSFARNSAYFSGGAIFSSGAGETVRA